MSGEGFTTMLIPDKNNAGEALIVIAGPLGSRVIRGFDGTILSESVLAIQVAQSEGEEI